MIFTSEKSPFTLLINTYDKVHVVYKVLTDTCTTVKQISQFASVDAEDDLVLTYM